MSDAPSPLLPLSVAHLISRFSLCKCGSIVFSANSEADREEMEVLRIESMILQCCNVLQVTAAERVRERKEL